MRDQLPGGIELETFLQYWTNTLLDHEKYRLQIEQMKIIQTVECL